MPVGCLWLVVAVRCVLIVVCCLVSVDCGMLFAACSSLLFAVCWLGRCCLVVAGCVLVDG